MKANNAGCTLSSLRHYCVSLIVSTVATSVDFRHNGILHFFHSKARPRNYHSGFHGQHHEVVSTALIMAELAQAPQQHRQPSRKGRKAWRKNVDISEVQQGLEDVRDEVLRG